MYKIQYRPGLPGNLLCGFLKEWQSQMQSMKRILTDHLQECCHCTAKYLYPLIAQWTRVSIKIMWGFYLKLLKITSLLSVWINLDVVALPDFGAGAMENWGLMTFHESSLMYLPSDKFTSKKAVIAVIMSHELGHQARGKKFFISLWGCFLWVADDAVKD